MAAVESRSRLREFFEYNLKPVWDLLSQGQFGFLAGAVIEEFTGRNPYFWYRERRGKDRIVTRQVRSHEMWIDLYDRGLSRHLFIRGVHEANATAAYRDALAELREETTDKVTVLDVGANIGYYVLEEADVLGERASVVAFEPDRENRRLLERNIEQNGYADHVDISLLAIDEHSGERTFYRSTHSNWNRLGGEGETEHADELVEEFPVETTSIDRYLDERGMEPADVNAVRMDLEGHELTVLRGMTDVLAADGPLVLFVEFHPDFGNHEKYEAALSRIEGSGFTIRHVDQYWNVLDVESFETLRDVEGSHVRVVFSRDID